MAMGEGDGDLRGCISGGLRTSSVSRSKSSGRIITCGWKLTLIRDFGDGDTEVGGGTCAGADPGTPNRGGIGNRSSGGRKQDK